MGTGSAQSDSLLLMVFHASMKDIDEAHVIFGGISQQVHAMMNFLWQAVYSLAALVSMLCELAA